MSATFQSHFLTLHLSYQHLAASGRTSFPSQPQVQLHPKFRMFFIKFFSLLQLCLRYKWKTVSNLWRHHAKSLHCRQSALWKPEQEKAAMKQSWWGLGGRLATKAKRSAENGSCQEMWRWRGAGEVGPPLPFPAPPPPSWSVWGFCHMRYIL